MSRFARELAAALAEELALVAGAMIGREGRVGPGAPRGGPQWTATIAAGGAASGSCTVAVDAAAAAAFTAVVLGEAGEVPADAVIDTVREICSQACGGVMLKPVAGGATLTVTDLAPADDLRPGDGWAVFQVDIATVPAPLTVTVWSTIEAAAAASAARAVRAAAPVAAPPAASAARASIVDARLDVILDIDLPLTVRFGRTELPLKTLVKLGPGSVIDLGRSPDDPVEIVVTNRVVARGEVVIVGGNYGIRILDVVSQGDRVRSLEG